MADVITALVRDWTHLRGSPAAHAALRRWQRHEPALAAYDSLAGLEGHMHNRATPAATVDAVFAALLRVHHDDPVAGRVVLALLVPSLLRHRGGGGDTDDRRAQLVAELWHAICHYTVERRPFAVPARLTRHAHKRAARAAAVVAPPPAADVSTASSDIGRSVSRVDDRLALTAAARRAAVSDADLALIAATRLGGWRVSDLADSGLEADRLRQRRHRAEARLRRALASSQLTPA